MNYLNYPVYYLERSDFDSSGNISNSRIPKHIPVVVMLQSNFCLHSNDAKPAFQKFANDYNKNVFCATVQGDGKELGEQGLHDFMTKLKGKFRGYPDYILYINGVKQSKNIEGRSYQDLVDFVS